MDNERSGIRNRLRQTREHQIYSTCVLLNSQNKHAIPMTISISNTLGIGLSNLFFH